MNVTAYELAPLPWGITVLRGFKLRNLQVLRRSLWGCDLAPYDVVFAFLSPDPMPELGAKIQREMRTGSLFISSSFPVPDWKPEVIRQIPDSRKTKLYCYRIP